MSFGAGAGGAPGLGEEIPMGTGLEGLPWYANLGLGALFASGLAVVGYVLGPYTPPQPEKEHGGMGGMMGMDPEQLMQMMAMQGGRGGAGGGGGGAPRHAIRGGPQGEEEEAMYEQLLGRLLQNINMAIAQRNNPAAIEHCQRALALCEEAWGPSSLHRALVLVPLARAHEAQNDSDEAVKALTEAADILQAHPNELPIENLAHVCDKLVSLLTSADKFVESEKWSLIAVQARQEEMLQDPGVPLVSEKYGAACASVGIVESRLGKFSLAEKYFSDALKVFYDVLPLSQNCARTLEYYTSCLHQQGKTEESITALEEYERVITGEVGNSLALCKTWRRAATLLFTIDEWSRCEALLLKAEAEEKKAGHPTDLQALCDLASVYWEMGDEEKALGKEAELRKCKVTAFNYQLIPTTRSNLLATLSCSFVKGKYQLELRVNRTRPMRKEGEPLEDADKVPRKIPRCYLDVTFENTDPNEAPITLSQEMPSFSLQLESTEMKEPPPDTWHKVTMVIYEDATRAKKIGHHHQLVYAHNDQLSPSTFFQ